MQDNIQILNLKEASTYLHCSTALLRQLIYEKEVPFFKLHSKYFFKKDILDKWLISKINDIEIGGFDDEL